MGIVVIGSTFVDVKGYPLGEYGAVCRNAGRVEQVHGGVARNVVENIANIELKPAFVSLVDDNGVGQDVINRLKERGVDTTHMVKTQGGMGMWLAIFNNDGDLDASISRRPDLHPILDILREHGDEIISAADSVAIELDLDEDVVEEILRLAHKHGKAVYSLISNMTIAMTRTRYFKDLGCFICNQQEASKLFAKDLDSMTRDQLALELPALASGAGFTCMVVTMGEKGAVYYSKDGEAGICPAKRVEVVDTTGAGDAFFSGVAAGLTYGKSLAEACEIGTSLAASVITTTENSCAHFSRQEFGL